MVRDGVKNEKSARESVIQGYYGGGITKTFSAAQQLLKATPFGALEASSVLLSALYFYIFSHL